MFGRWRPKAPACDGILNPRWEAAGRVLCLEAKHGLHVLPLQEHAVAVPKALAQARSQLQRRLYLQA